MSGHTDNRVVIAAPLDRVWDVTNDVASWPSLFGEYAAAEILDEAENYVQFRLTTRPDENERTWSWVSERRLDPVNHVVQAQRVDPGPFEYMTIRWEYRRTDGGVELRWIQDFQLKPTAPVNDAEMTDRINRNSPRELARIKAVLEAGRA